MNITSRPFGQQVNPPSKPSKCASEVLSRSGTYPLRSTVMLSESFVPPRAACCPRRVLKADYLGVLPAPRRRDSSQFVTGDGVFHDTVIPRRMPDQPAVMNVCPLFSVLSLLKIISRWPKRSENNCPFECSPRSPTRHDKEILSRKVSGGSWPNRHLRVALALDH